MTSSLLLLLQLQLPSSAAVEGNVCWNPKNNTDFDYQARGKLRVERQQCQVSKTQLRTLIIACLKGQYVRFGQLSNPYSEHKVGSISPKKLLTAANCSCCFMSLNVFFFFKFFSSFLYSSMEHQAESFFIPLSVIPSNQRFPKH